ncbi:MAG TPA: tRNA (N6-isopentenyl adenosine(37)-C2)-methylthiotransferase MiaB [Bacillota bacterium]|nr:tRNA (N6-isopentenyl adenosine(37)-C2)-methylthiotransferase MiaB [Bacillota bacterium]HPL54791.1 tRNA (N6-isopentenyl adenosine(37)-C2)-methylthiotransferase MiaB [Bacillota bacterium]
MSERKAPEILDNDELLRQKKIILRIRENNELEQLKTGRQKRMHVITFGCQQNNSDSEKIMGMLAGMGYTYTEKREQADIIIINTCCVRENAELKLYGNIGALKHLKADNPSLIIGVCGCMMQQEHAAETIRRKYRHVDLVFGTHNIYKLPELLERSMNEKYTLIDILNTEGTIIEDIPVLREEKFKAWVTIMYGCNNFCSYCIVPYVRGRERSRKPEDIIREIEGLAKNGCKEVTLLGQNVNSYGKDLSAEIDFADLIRLVNEIKGIERIRFMTSHPKDISDKLIYTMRDCKKVCEQLHLPFQAGSNEILRRMNRKYTKEEYLSKVIKAKWEIPGIALSTDVIVGFPGETDEDFEETLDVLRQVEFDQVFMFIYSKRKGTIAAEMEDIRTYEDKHRNFEKLVKLQNEISRKANETYLGKTVEVLAEGFSKSDPSKYTGRTRTGKVVNFIGNNGIVGKLVNVRINEIHSWFINGEMVNEVK